LLVLLPAAVVSTILASPSRSYPSFSNFFVTIVPAHHLDRALSASSLIPLGAGDWLILLLLLLFLLLPWVLPCSVCFFLCVLDRRRFCLIQHPSTIKSSGEVGTGVEKPDEAAHSKCYRPSFALMCVALAECSFWTEQSII
jgi:hypothetical protein